MLSSVLEGLFVQEGGQQEKQEQFQAVGGRRRRSRRARGTRRKRGRGRRTRRH